LAETPQPTGGTIPTDAEQQQVMIQIDESKAHSTYVNAWQINFGQDEIVCDLGVQMPRMIADKPAISFAVGTRVVLSPGSAMRFAAALQQTIAQREQRMQQYQAQQQQHGGAGH
jgi:hypothetical protein